MSSAGQLFIRREYAAIKGRRSVVFWLLYAIVLSSLAAIVVGRAALDHLRQKMDDPFTNTVSIPVLNARHAGNYRVIKSYLDSCAEHHAFDAAASSGSYAGGWFIYSRARGEGSFTYAHSFGFRKDSTLLRNILGPGNLLADLSGGKLRAADTYRDGIIITHSLLDELGIDIAAARGRELLILDGAYTLPLRVVAVVRTLPDKSKVYCEHTLLHSIEFKDDVHLLPTDDVDAFTVLLDADAARIAEQSAAWEQELRALITEATDIRFEPCTTAATNAVQAIIQLDRPLDIYHGPVFYQKGLNNLRGSLAELAPRIRWSPRYKDPDATRDFGADTDPENPDRYDDLSITFRSLDRISDFQHDVERVARVELDLDRVESQKNFAVVSRLSQFLIGFLVLFAVLAILLFLYNTLKNHLERIQMNLGTFLAFGIPESFLISGYMRILFRLVARVVALVLLTLLLVQGILLLLDRAGIAVPDMLRHLSVLGNGWLYIALAVMASACALIFRWQLRTFLARPPGDLIYART